MDDIKKSFEKWAKEHKFILTKDTDLDIYANVYTQGAWMAYQAGCCKWQCKFNHLTTSISFSIMYLIVSLWASSHISLRSSLVKSLPLSNCVWHE